VLFLVQAVLTGAVLAAVALPGEADAVQADTEGLFALACLLFWFLFGTYTAGGAVRAAGF